jgi:tripartite-type tricarboxylate transporter receptor subunit TctC
MKLRRAFREVTAIGIVMLALLGTPTSGVAQTYPTHEIRLIVPLSPGSSVDSIARAIAPELGKQLGQPIIVENRPGAESILATQYVKGATPDGYTLILVIPAHAINVFLYPKSAYDPIKDFTPVALIASNMNVLVVPPKFPAKDLKEFIALAKAKPGTLNFGAVGGTSGASADLFNLMAGVQTADITYKGASEAQNDMLGGRLDFMFTAVSSALPQVRAGNLRALAVTGAQRFPGLPDVPTVAELVPGYEVTGWYGIVGPAGMPATVVTTLNHAMFKALESPEVKTRLAAMGFDPAPPSDPAHFTSFIRSEVKKWGAVIKPRG